MTTGQLIGIAIRPARRAAMDARDRATITADGGLAGDHAGKRPLRLVTVMAREAWEAALADLDPPLGGDEDLPWTTRRANLLVKGVHLPRAAGGVIRIGDVVLEITGQTNPCGRMEEARAGLLKALGPDWRGGVLCKVRAAGDVALGDAVEILEAPEETSRRLP